MPALECSGKVATKLRQDWVLDGGLADFLPTPPGSVRPLRIACIPAARVTSRLGWTNGSAQLRDLIAPTEGVAEPRPIARIPVLPVAVPLPSAMQVLIDALLPVTDERMKQMMEAGHRDATQWIRQQEQLGPTEPLAFK